MLPIAIALAQFAPMIAGMLGGPKAEDVAAKVVSVAQAVTGQSTPDAALAAIQSNPELAMQFQSKVVESHVELARISADVEKAQLDAARSNAADINKTMQTEATAEHWPTYSWRPFIGFCFGLLALITGATAAVCYIGVMFFQVNPQVLAQLPALIGAEAGVMATMAPVLGIASWFRGKMQSDPSIPTVNRG